MNGVIMEHPTLVLGRREMRAGMLRRDEAQVTSFHRAANVSGFSARRLIETACSGAVFVPLDIRPAEDIPEFLRQGDNPRPDGPSTAEKWRHKTKDGTVVGVIITSSALTYKGRPAELVLAPRETSGKARAAVTAN